MTTDIIINYFQFNQKMTINKFSFYLLSRNTKERKKNLFAISYELKLQKNLLNGKNDRKIYAPRI